MTTLTGSNSPPTRNVEPQCRSLPLLFQTQSSVCWFWQPTARTRFGNLFCAGKMRAAISFIRTRDSRLHRAIHSESRPLTVARRECQFEASSYRLQRKSQKTRRMYVLVRQ